MAYNNSRRNEANSWIQSRAAQDSTIFCPLPAYLFITKPVTHGRKYRSACREKIICRGHRECAPFVGGPWPPCSPCRAFFFFIGRRPQSTWVRALLPVCVRSSVGVFVCILCWSTRLCAYFFLFRVLRFDRFKTIVRCSVYRSFAFCKYWHLLTCSITSRINFKQVHILGTITTSLNRPKQTLICCHHLRVMRILSDWIMWQVLHRLYCITATPPPTTWFRQDRLSCYKVLLTIPVNCLNSAPWTLEYSTYPIGQ